MQLFVRIVDTRKESAVNLLFLKHTMTSDLNNGFSFLLSFWDMFGGSWAEKPLENNHLNIAARAIKNKNYI